MQTSNLQNTCTISNLRMPGRNYFLKINFAQKLQCFHFAYFNKTCFLDACDGRSIVWSAGNENPLAPSACNLIAANGNGTGVQPLATVWRQGIAVSNQRSVIVLVQQFLVAGVKLHKAGVNHCAAMRDSYHAIVFLQSFQIFQVLSLHYRPDQPAILRSVKIAGVYDMRCVRKTWTWMCLDPIRSGVHSQGFFVNQVPRDSCQAWKKKLQKACPSSCFNDSLRAFDVFHGKQESDQTANYR